MSTRLGFRTRGGPTQGWGNIFRLSSFARYCRETSPVDATFFAEGPVEVADYLLSQGFEVVMLPEGIDPKEEAHLLASHSNLDVLFAEMLDITPERQAVLHGLADRLVIFDDLCDHIYDASLVVCGQDLPSHANRSLSNPETRFLVGYDYFLCRPEFLPYADRKREHAKTVQHVLVTLGGGGYDVGYLKSAQALARGNARTTFVLGFADHPGLAEKILAILPQAKILRGVDNMGQLLWDCDLVIGSAGYTKLEAALTQTPCLMISVQWHQIPLAQVFHERTGMPDLGYMAYTECDQLQAALKAMAPSEVRTDHARRARDVVDGRGFERVHGAVFSA